MSKRVSLSEWLFGYAAVSVPKAQFCRITTRMLRHGIAYKGGSECGEDGDTLSFRIPLRQKKALLALAEETPPLCVTVDGGHGLPLFPRKALSRPGLCLGTLAGVCLLLLSSRYLWAIEIEGNERIPDEAVLARLAEHGFSVGCYLPGVDYYALDNDLLIGWDDVAWIAVNRTGTTALVRLVETYELPQGDTEDRNGSPANLVASRDGYIVRTEIRAGQSEVRAGQTVKKGQLLIGGVWEGGRVEPKTYTFVRARGHIYAETLRQFSVTIPYSDTVTVEVGHITLDRSVKFFSKTIKFQKNSSILPQSYDKIVRREQLSLFGTSALLPAVPIPVFLTTEEAVVTEEKAITRSRAEAESLAKAALAKQFRDEVPDAEILEWNTVTEEDETGVTLHAVIRCVEDIAVTQEIGRVTQDSTP